MDKNIRVITALGNQYIQDNFKKSFGSIDFLIDDLSYQEGLFEALQNMRPDAVIINLGIEGDLNRNVFIERIREINETVKIILIMKEEDKEFTNWLVTRAVYDVFTDGGCTFDEIYEALIREQKVIIKREIRKEYIEKEKVITKEKVVKEIISVNFKKLVLSVWNNCEFACELAYIVAKLTRFKVLLIDLDLISPGADLYLNLNVMQNNKGRDSPVSIGLGAVMEALDKKTISFNLLEHCCMKRNECSNLYILMDAMDAETYDRYKGKDITPLIDQMQQHFDIIILNLNKHIYEPIFLSSLRKSDYSLIAITPNADSIREFEAYFLMAGTKYSIPVDRCRFIAFEYKKSISFPINHIKNIFTDQYFLGIISYSTKRESFRNIRSFYAKWAVRKAADEYIQILSGFNILPERTFINKINGWLKHIFRRFSKLKCSKEAHRIQNATEEEKDE